MLLGTADEGAAVDLVRGGGSDDAPGPAAGCRVNRGPVALVTGVALISGTPAGWNVTSGRLPARVPGQVMYPQPVHGAGRVVRKVARRAGSHRPLAARQSPVADDPIARRRRTAIPARTRTADMLGRPTVR